MSAKQTMNKAEDNKLMTAYMKELKTPKGKIMYNRAKKMKASWDAEEGAVVTTTKGVAPKMLKIVQSNLTCLKSVLEKVKIRPLLLNNHCFFNANFVEKQCGYKAILGYNITSCPCGKVIAGEIHSLNVLNNNTLIDYTKDFAGEKYKWFIPLKCQKPISFVKQMTGDKLDMFFLSLGCCCREGLITLNRVYKDKKTRHYFKITKEETKEFIDTWGHLERIIYFG